MMVLFIGVSGTSNNPNGAGIVGDGGAGGSAGFFDGDVNVTGTLSKAAAHSGSTIRSTPANNYLSHSFVESPDMKNIYDGVAVFDAAGEAIVTLPDWFEALNRRLPLSTDPHGCRVRALYRRRNRRNQFRIAGGHRGRKVSWQVTGIRHDAFANANRIQVEEMKPDAAVGTYLHPEAFGLPVEKGWSAAAIADTNGAAKDG